MMSLLWLAILALAVVVAWFRYDQRLTNLAVLATIKRGEARVITLEQSLKDMDCELRGIRLDIGDALALKADKPVKRELVPLESGGETYPKWMQCSVCKTPRRSRHSTEACKKKQEAIK